MAQFLLCSQVNEANHFPANFVLYTIHKNHMHVKWKKQLLHVDKMQSSLKVMCTSNMIPLNIMEQVFRISDGHHPQLL